MGALAVVNKNPLKDKGNKVSGRTGEEDLNIAMTNMDRLSYAKRSGHDKYVVSAKRNEDMYLGGGLMWTDADKEARDGRPCIELNHIMPAVNTALGMQLHSRVDMDFQPRGEGADEQKAAIISKIVRQICDNVEYHWHESQVFEDGQIMQRGFLDVRMDFSENFQGDVSLEILDPLDCFPDPDAQTYNPEGWNDFIVARWMRDDQVKGLFGEEVATTIKDQANQFFDGAENYKDRSHFGEDSDGTGGDIWVRNVGSEKKQVRLYYVIDRQWRELVREEVLVLKTGEKKPVKDLSEQQIADVMVDGGFLIKDLVKRVHWSVTCGKTILFDGLSPYKTFSVIPYFPIFRRGRTRGMVDNLISPNELENKSITNFLEIWTSAANSGWIMFQGSLVNTTKEDLARDGGKNGLVLEVTQGKEPPKRIEPKQAPQGAERLIDRAEYAIKTISGMSDTLQGQKGSEVSGVAIQSKQFQGQMQQGRPIDNLALTRRMVARKLVELVQQFFTEERVFRIVDPETKEVKEEITINQVTEFGDVLNDVTLGTYDVIIGETQTSVTFRQNQFDQMITMVEKGVPIRPQRVALASTLADKHEVAKEIEQDQASQGSNPLDAVKVKVEEAKVGLIAAQEEKTKSDTVNANVDAQYSAIQTAGVIAATPATSPLADSLLRSANYVDHDAAPIVPTYGGAPAGPGITDQGAAVNQLSQLPPNTNPTDPVPTRDPGALPAGVPGPPVPGNAGVGANAGIETQRLDGAGV